MEVEGGGLRTVSMTGPWCSVASALDQDGHFRNQGMSASQKKNPLMTETDGKDKTGHTHKLANRYLESTKPGYSLVGDAKMK